MHRRQECRSVDCPQQDGGGLLGDGLIDLCGLFGRIEFIGDQLQVDAFLLRILLSGRVIGGTVSADIVGAEQDDFRVSCGRVNWICHCNKQCDDAGGVTRKWRE
jgi:hypothetical protein